MTVKEKLPYLQNSSRRTSKLRRRKRSRQFRKRKYLSTNTDDSEDAMETSTAKRIKTEYEDEINSTSPVSNGNAKKIFGPDNTDTNIMQNKTKNQSKFTYKETNKQISSGRHSEDNLQRNQIFRGTKNDTNINTSKPQTISKKIVKDKKTRTRSVSFNRKI